MITLEETIFNRTAMKRFFTLLCIAVLGIAAFPSCQKDALGVDDKPVVKSAIMRVNADAVQSKTFITEVDASNYTLSWSEGDAIACFEVSMVEKESVLTPTIQGKVTSTALASSGASASFEMDFSGNSGEANFSYIFVYPASKYSKNGDTYRALIEKDQSFSATSFDKYADVLISRAITDQTSRPTSVDAEFERIGATALMNIKAPTTTETIRKITFSTTEGNIQGYYKVYPLTGTYETALYSGGKSIELTPASPTAYSGTIPVWFRLAEITLSNNFTVSVETNKKTYTKVVDLASASRTIEFTNSGLTKFNVNMSAVAGVTNASLDDGDYYIVAKSGTYYYALSSEASGTRLAYEQLADFDPAASSYLGTNDNLIWTITNDSDAITVEQGTGTYLTPASAGASTGATKKTYTLANGSADGTLVLNSVDKSGYGLRYNVGSNYFAFYNSDPTPTMIADMFFMPKDPRSRVTAPSNVEASAGGTTITVIWDDASDANIDHYLVTLSGTSSDSQTVAVGVEGYEFTGLATGTYSVTVVAVPINSATHLNSVETTISSLVIGGGLSGLTASWTLTSGNTTSLASASGNTNATITVTNGNSNKIEGAAAGMYSQKMSEDDYWLLTIPNVKNVTADTEVTISFGGVKINKTANGTITYQCQYSWDNSTWNNTGDTYTETATGVEKSYTFKPGVKASGTLYIRYYATSGGSTSKGSHYLGSVTLSAE